jgi:hypothetical protein
MSSDPGRRQVSMLNGSFFLEMGLHLIATDDSEF